MSSIRIDQHDMTTAQWVAFKDAVKALKAQTAAPNYDDMAMAHSHHMHMGQAHLRYTFLPWHREYLLQFENALRAIDPSVFLPYWNWVDHPVLPDELSNAAEWGVTRTMQQGDRISATRKTEVDNANAETDFRLFHSRLSVPHGAVHIQVGGEMSMIEISPRDVLFWLHHAFLDKLWADWSATHPGENPTDGDMTNPLTFINARLIPTSILTRTSAQVFSLTDLGYEYQ